MSEMTSLTNKQLIEVVAELDEHTTAGPWQSCDAREGTCPCGIIWGTGGSHARPYSIAAVSSDGAVYSSDAQRLRDTRFIAQARSLVPELRTRLVDAMAKVEKLKSELHAANTANTDVVDLHLQVDAALSEAKEAKVKLALLAEQYKTLEAEKLELQRQLAMVKTDAQGVWRYQGDGEDHLESLSCPLVMSAETFQAVAARAETAEKLVESMKTSPRPLTKTKRQGTTACDFCGYVYAPEELSCRSCIAYNAAVAGMKAAAEEFCEQLDMRASRAWLNEYGIFAFVEGVSLEFGTAREASAFSALTQIARSKVELPLDKAKPAPTRESDDMFRKAACEIVKLGTHAGYPCVIVGSRPVGGYRGGQTIEETQEELVEEIADSFRKSVLPKLVLFQTLFEKNRDFIGGLLDEISRFLCS